MEINEVRHYVCIGTKAVPGNKSERLRVSWSIFKAILKQLHQDSLLLEIDICPGCNISNWLVKADNGMMICMNCGDIFEK